MLAFTTFRSLFSWVSECRIDFRAELNDNCVICNTPKGWSLSLIPVFSISVLHCRLFSNRSRFGRFRHEVRIGIIVQITRVQFAKVFWMQQCAVVFLPFGVFVVIIRVTVQVRSLDLARNQPGGIQRRIRILNLEGSFDQNFKCFNPNVGSFDRNPISKIERFDTKANTTSQNQGDPGTLSPLNVTSSRCLPASWGMKLAAYFSSPFLATWQVTLPPLTLISKFPKPAPDPSTETFYKCKVKFKLKEFKKALKEFKKLLNSSRSS